MRVIVCGSRDFTDSLLIRTVLDELHTGPMQLVHGACPTGADFLAQQWADVREGSGPRITVFRFVADWRRWGKHAGPHRNKQMIQSGADLCLAFYLPVAPGVDPLSVNRGTRGCVKLARDAGIPVRPYGLENQETPDYEQETLPI
jgi:hypothetical protein